MSINSRRWYALAVVLAAVFLAAFDFNVVTIAIPSIQRGLGTSFGEIQLIVAGYALSFAVLLITGGRLGDLYGRRWMYVIGMTGFTIASALCGFARSPTALVGARLLQGAFAAVMVPQALSFIQVTFRPREQSLAYAMYGMTIGFGMIAGQLLGGLLLSADLLGLGWRPVFLVNLPFGVVAITLAWWLVRESRAPAGLKLDPVGVVLVSAALALLLYPLIRGEAAAWPTWTWVSLAGAVVLLGAFARSEPRSRDSAARRRTHGRRPPDLDGRRTQRCVGHLRARVRPAVAHLRVRTREPAGATRQLHPGRRAARRGGLRVGCGLHAAAAVLRAGRGGDRKCLPGGAPSPSRPDGIRAGF